MEQEQNRPLPPTPSADSFDGLPEDVYEQINKYGTYEIQDTADADTLFPLIATGLPRDPLEKKPRES